MPYTQKTIETPSKQGNVSTVNGKSGYSAKRELITSENIVELHQENYGNWIGICILQRG